MRETLEQDPTSSRSARSATIPAQRGGRAARRQNRRRKRKRGLKAIAMVAAAVIVTAVGGGFYLYQHLNGNIKSSALYSGTSGNAGSSTPDAFGRTPINLLVIGNGGRVNSTDCKLGGACGTTGPNTSAQADVMMVVHVSADRSNITAMSVPRDIVTNMPGCKDPQTGATMAAQYGQINGSLNYGPGCTVAAVHQLTGIPIDHFMMVDFSGLVQMSDAVGGVPVCVTANVYDPYSHLKLTKGTHTLKGVSALEFVRSRHAFGDGSDLGRTYAQHIFLSSMIRTLKSAGTLTNPTALYSLADAATKALTVDTGIGSIPKLVSLGGVLNTVPSNRITFTTMQNNPDPSNAARVVLAPSAQNLFNAIINDQSLTTSTGGKSAAAAATAKAAPSTAAPKPTPAAVPHSQIAVQVENGTNVTGRAAAITTALIGKGFSQQTTAGNAPAPAAKTSISYGAGSQSEALAVASALGVPASAVKQGTGSGVVLVIGSDWSTGTSFTASGASPAPLNTKAALSQAHAQTATTKSCAPVSTFNTVVINGVPKTPTEAYAAVNGKIADSAP